jgi:hypothetical protein
MSYVITSGFIGKELAQEKFFSTWSDNLMRNADVNPSKIFVVCSRGDSPKSCPHFIQRIRVGGDLGHICRDASQKHQMEGWAVDVMIGALLAYNDESDFLFIEQDCLPFGPFVSKLQEECKDIGMIFGSNSWMPSAQSLFYVRHSFIPQFVSDYLLAKIANHKAGGEDVFANLEKRHGTGIIKRMSFGFDRDRPPGGIESMKAGDVWYIQQITVAELQKLRECGHIV